MKPLTYALLALLTSVTVGVAEETVLTSVPVGVAEEPVLTSVPVGVAEEPLKWSFEGLYLKPDQDDDWDKAIGAEIKAIFWQSNDFGFALAAGLQQWTPNDEMYSYGATLRGGIGYGYAGQLDGDATMIPIGASALWRINLREKATLVLEGGLRYVIVNSDVKLKYAEALAGPRGIVVYSDEKKNEIDDGIVGIIAANIQFKLSDKVDGFVGVGAQFDISKGGQTIGGRDIDRDNELKGVFIRAGIGW